MAIMLLHSLSHCSSKVKAKFSLSMPWRHVWKVEVQLYTFTMSVVVQDGNPH